MSGYSLNDSMTRASHISTAQILDAAKAVFLEKGFHEATTALIAARAGISEGSIFNHFKDKATLFACAMELKAASVLDALASRAGQGDPRANLEAVTLLWLDFMLELVPKVMMVWSHRASLGSPINENHGPPPEVVERASYFFQTEMDLGRMRDGDSEILARIWLGILWSYATAQVMGGSRGRPISKSRYVRAAVDQLWHGLAPDHVPDHPATSSATRRKP